MTTIDKHQNAVVATKVAAMILRFPFMSRIVAQTLCFVGDDKTHHRTLAACNRTVFLDIVRRE